MSDYELGLHAEAIRSLKVEVADLNTKMDSVVAFVNKVDGAWKSAAAFLAVIGAAVGAVVALITDTVLGRK